MLCECWINEWSGAKDLSGEDSGLLRNTGKCGVDSAG